jgi:hypothetical protein
MYGTLGRPRIDPILLPPTGVRRHHCHQELLPQRRVLHRRDASSMLRTTRFPVQTRPWLHGKITTDQPISIGRASNGTNGQSPESRQREGAGMEEASWEEATTGTREEELDGLLLRTKISAVLLYPEPLLQPNDRLQHELGSLVGGHERVWRESMPTPSRSYSALERG